jgi:hypothetical protein
MQIKFYPSEEYIYILELWGASTKHPDVVFHMSNFQMAPWVDKEDEKDVESQVYQWLLECASKMLFPQQARQIVAFADAWDFDDYN